MAATSVEAYLAALPTPQRRVLSRLRTQIRTLAPEAAERISYGMPAYKVDGKPLVYFGAAEAHCGLYGNHARFLSAEELAGLNRSKGTIRFTPQEPLPPWLVAKIIGGRLAEIRAAAAQDVAARDPR